MSDLEQQQTLTWENIDVTVPKKKSIFMAKTTRKSVKILKKVSGQAKAGRLLAIMGASGSGKTTLLNVLTRRVESNLVTNGRVLSNGKPIGVDIQKISAFVQQDDLFAGKLTVREHLWFQAALRLDEKLSHSYRNARIDEVIKELGLADCQNTVIGDADKAKSISGGERKRLSFASEVITKPSIIFCDEPTSGLDSFMAENIVHTLRAMARQGKTVISTIHQPSSQIFSLFDDLMLLARGQVAYAGDASSASQFFADIGFPCPSAFNPADYYITTLAVSPRNEEQSIEKIEKICQSFKDRIGEAESVFSTNSSAIGTEGDETPATDDYRPEFKTGFLNQLRYTTWRANKVTFRDRKLQLSRLGQTILVALFAGLIYLRQTIDPKGVQNINGAIFLVLAHCSFGNSFSILSALPNELPVFRRDHQNGMYSTLTYLLSKILGDALIFTLLPCLFSLIVYWMVGLREDADAFFTFTATVVLLTQVVVAYSFFVCCATGNATIATTIGGPLIVPLMLFGGLLLNDESIPSYFIWLQYLSWFKYAFEILVVNQWHNIGEIGKSVQNIPTFLKNSTLLADAGCILNGEDVLEYNNYSIENHARNFACLVALLICFYILAYFSLSLRVNMSRIQYWQSERKSRRALGGISKNRKPAATKGDQAA